MNPRPAARLETRPARQLAALCALLCMALVFGCDRGRSEAVGSAEGRAKARPQAGGDATTGGLLPAPPAPAAAEFVSSGECAACHPAELQAWTNSHHDLAMQEVSEATVLGDFDDASFRYGDVTSRFFRREGKFFVHTDGADGVLADFEIAYVFGVHPLQQYLVRFAGGRLQPLGIAWDVAGERWFHLYPDDAVVAGDALHWTGRLQTWNHMCADCHSTNLERGYDLETDSYDTTWAEIDVACEACHGPGSQHVAWAERQAEGAGESTQTAGTRPPVYAPASELDTCAPCHARRSHVSAQAAHGEPFLDHFYPALLDEGLYYPDGQILEEVYVWGSFAQSKMHGAGVRCSDCHDPHSLELRASGNDLCTRCHQTGPPKNFETLRAAAYDTPEHHHHEAGTAGAACIDCHMPSRTYMVVDPRHDHSLRIPRPDLSEKLGTPDACAGCHEGRPASWAAAALDEWFPRAPGEARATHYGEALALARSGGVGSTKALIDLVGDGSAPAIARATALRQMLAAPSPRALPVVKRALTDDEPLVRAAAATALPAVLMATGDRSKVPAAVQAATPLLTDERRVVRVEAARALSRFPAAAFDAASVGDLAKAIGEYEAAQQAEADQPGAHLNLGVLHAAGGDAERAETDYRRAIQLDGAFAPARFNLANLLNAQGRNEDAKTVLEELIAAEPGNGEAHYSLGLLLAEMGRYEQSAEQLALAAQAMPERARVRLNLGLALQRLGRIDEAALSLREVLVMEPQNIDALQAIVMLEAQRGDWRAALPHAESLAVLLPGDPQTQRLVAQVRRAATTD